MESTIITQEKLNEPKLEDKFIEELIREMKVKQPKLSLDEPQAADF